MPTRKRGALYPDEYRAAAAAFAHPEKPTENGEYASDAVYTTLRRQHFEFANSNDIYISPYTTIMGPSGVGKTFSVKQLAVRYGLYVAYSNLVKTNSNAYPGPVTMGLTPAYEPHDDMIPIWETFIKNQICIAKSCEAVGITPAGLFEFLTSSKGDMPIMRESFTLHFKHKTEIDTATMANLLQPVKAQLETLELNTRPIFLPKDEDCPIIICLDEARTLLVEGDRARFETLRVAADNVARAEGFGRGEGVGRRDQSKRNISFFVVLLDTTSKISNFTPPTQYDYVAGHSAKVTKRIFFQPIHEIDSFGLFSEPAVNLSDPGTDDAMSQLISHGRPLWGAFLKAGYTWQQLGFASTKIAGQKDPLAYGISLLTYRMNFYVCSSSLAEAMAAASLRYLISVSDDRNNLITTQPSEPVLALAASCLLQDPTVRLSSIRAWISALHSGAVSPGDIGEQVASLILLFASDYASEPRKALPKSRLALYKSHSLIIHPVAPGAIPVGNLLAALLGEDVWRNMLKINYSLTTMEILETGLVFFNHFIRAASVPSAFVLETAYKRGAALFLPANFVGMDVAIPIRMPAAGRMSVLLIQIKNRRHDSFTPGLKLYMTEALRKAEKTLGLSAELHGIVGLVMCLRTNKEVHFAPIDPGVGMRTGIVTRDVKRAKVEDAGPEHAQFLGMAFGLDLALYPCIRPPGKSTHGENEAKEICNLLVNLLETWPDAFSKAATESNYAKRLLDPFFGLYRGGERYNSAQDGE